MTTDNSRGLLFGSVAESYERFRLGYPDEVVDRTLSYAGGQVAAAVEVGAGTGKATRAFASRGIAVTALEPDPDMFAVLERETAAMPVTPVQSRYEEYVAGPVDLLYAASAWHWTDPATRWTHAAGLLVDDGVVAVFGSPMRIADPAVQDAVADALPPTLDDEAFRPHGGDWQRGRPWPAYELDGSDLFTDVEEHLLAREVVVPQKEYVGYLSTLSAYLELPMMEREQVLHLAAGVVPAQVRLDLTVSLCLARRT